MGDFYHSKIIPTSLAITYDNILDINPEGIGVQPMIAHVTLNFNFVGGMGLKSAVDTIQNALTFNYYANTEIYDERAEATEDTTTNDTKLVKRILETAGVNPSKIADNKTQNAGGDTIGARSNIKVSGGIESGDTSYQKIMDEMLTQSQAYISSVLNKSNEVINQYNLYVLQMICSDRVYKTGENGSYTGGPTTTLNIFGKPNNLQQNIDKLFAEFVSNVESNSIEYLKVINGLIPENNQKFKASVCDRIKTNFLSFIKSQQPSFSSSLFNIIQELTTVQQDLVKTFAKIDFVNNSSDGYIDTKQSTVVFSLSATTDVTTPATDNATNTAEELDFDYVNLTDGLFKFFEDYSELVPIDPNSTTYDYQAVTVPNIPDYGDKLLYFFLNQTILDSNKRQTFVQALCSGVDTEKNINERTTLEVTQLFFTNLADLTYSTLKTSQTETLKILEGNETYTKFQPYKPEKTRKFTYIQDNQNQLASQYLKNLYKDGNSNTDNNTYNGKNVFN